MIDVVWNNWVFKTVQMKECTHFHSHYQDSSRLMMRTPEYLWLLHRQTRPHRQSWGNVWKHAPNYLDLMCEQRFGSSLFGLVSHRVPNRDGWSMISSGWTNTKWRRRHREGLGGVVLHRGRKAWCLAAVSQIRIWERNISSLERGRKGNTQVGRKITVKE